MRGSDFIWIILAGDLVQCPARLCSGFCFDIEQTFDTDSNVIPFKRNIPSQISFTTPFEGTTVEILSMHWASSHAAKFRPLADAATCRSVSAFA
jgi:hypothetical protein